MSLTDDDADGGSSLVSIESFRNKYELLFVDISKLELSSSLDNK